LLQKQYKTVGFEIALNGKIKEPLDTDNTNG